MMIYEEFSELKEIDHADIDDKTGGFYDPPDFDGGLRAELQHFKGKFGQ